MGLHATDDVQGRQQLSTCSDGILRAVPWRCDVKGGILVLGKLNLGLFFGLFGMLNGLQDQELAESLGTKLQRRLN